MKTLKSLMSLGGRCALITGATGGLGRVMADSLAELGASLILVDREEKKLIDLKKDLNDRWNININYFVCDLEEEGQRSHLVTSLNAGHQDLSILINNAAFVGSNDLQGWNTSLELQKVETWRRALEVNLTAVFDLCQRLAPLLKVSEGANIINIASIYGAYGPDWRLYEDTSMGNPAAYAASKGGLIQLSKWLATTLAPNIRVNCISPGGIIRNQPKTFIDRYEARTPLQRMATEDDFRGIVAYLSSDLSAYVTGQNIFVDGGWGQW